MLKINPAQIFQTLLEIRKNFLYIHGRDCIWNTAHLNISSFELGRILVAFDHESVCDVSRRIWSTNIQVGDECKTRGRNLDFLPIRRWSQRRRF